MTTQNRDVEGLPGMLRMIHSPFPTMVMQDKDHVAFLYEYMPIWRLVDSNRRECYPDVEDTFFGDSKYFCPDTISTPGIWLAPKRQESSRWRPVRGPNFVQPT
jgi:hypothetical protein